MFEIALWPNGAPGSAGLDLTELCVERGDAALPDRAISQITQPRLQVYRPPAVNGTVVLLIPGGGYQRVVVDKEGAEVAEYLTAQGITVAVLIYRLPAEGHAQAADVPLQDAQRALRCLRAAAPSWGLVQPVVGVFGFSAGGHVAASLATRFDALAYTSVDAHDALSARPDFVVLGYPVISMSDEIAHMGSRQRLLGDAPGLTEVLNYSPDRCVNSHTPPCFVFQADDDHSVLAENAVCFYLALRRAGVAAELHVFRRGGHGFALRRAMEPEGVWPSLLLAWLQNEGFAPLR